MTNDPTLQQEWVVNAAPTSKRPRLRVLEVWRNRELIFFFAQRDVKVRYKQATLGAAWAVLQPLLGAVMFTIVFSGIAGIEVEDRSYFRLRADRLRRLELLLDGGELLHH